MNRLIFFCAFIAVLQSVCSFPVESVERPSREMSMRRLALAELLSMKRIDKETKEAAISVLSSKDTTAEFDELLVIWNLAFVQTKPRIVEYLLQLLPDLDKEFYKGYLEKAVFMQSEEILKVLLEDTRFRPEADENTALRIASSLGFPDMVRILMNDHRVDPSDKENAAIIQAAENGHAEVVQLLMQDSRVDPSDRDNKAIELALENGYLDVADILLKDDRVQFSDECLGGAIERGDYDTVEWLFAEMKPTGDHFIRAILGGDVDIILLLLDDGRVNDQALKIARSNGFKDIQSMLESLL